MADDSLIADVIDLVERNTGIIVGTGTLTVDSDLYAAGMSSFASVDVMISVEEAFDIEFPQALIQRDTFATVRAIAQAVEQIRG